MSFFEQPILNSPYAQPGRHWELDADGQPTAQIIDARRRSDLVVQAPPLYIQEKIQLKVLIDGLLRATRECEHAQDESEVMF